jgi:hypothetical protein
LERPVYADEYRALEVIDVVKSEPGITLTQIACRLNVSELTARKAVSIAWTHSGIAYKAELIQGNRHHYFAI